MRRPPTALLIDFDGVLRHHDPALARDIEARYDLAAGTLRAALFEPGRLRAVVLGQLRDADWMAAVGDAVGVPAAVRQWWAGRGQIDSAVRALVAWVRAAGVPVALVTNATDRLDEDLAGFGLDRAFDAVVNSSVLGVAKPSAGFFAAACAAVHTPPRQCLLLDDQPRNIAGARAAGLFAHRYAGHADLAYVAAALIPPAAA